MPVPGMRRTQPQRRDLCKTTMVGVPLSALIARVIDIVEESHVCLFVESDLDEIVRRELEIVVQVVHDKD